MTADTDYCPACGAAAVTYARTPATQERQGRCTGCGSRWGFDAEGQPDALEMEPRGELIAALREALAALVDMPWPVPPPLAYGRSTGKRERDMYVLRAQRCEMVAAITGTPAPLERWASSDLAALAARMLALWSDWPQPRIAELHTTEQLCDMDSAIAWAQALQGVALCRHNLLTRMAEAAEEEDQ